MGHRQSAYRHYFVLACTHIHISPATESFVAVVETPQGAEEVLLIGHQLTKKEYQCPWLRLEGFILPHTEPHAEESLARVSGKQADDPKALKSLALRTFLKSRHELAEFTND